MSWRPIILIALLLGLSRQALPAVDPTTTPFIMAPTLLETVVETPETPAVIRKLVQAFEFKSVADPVMRRVDVRPCNTKPLRPPYWTAERAASAASAVSVSSGSRRVSTPTRVIAAVGDPHLTYYSSQPGFRLTISL